MFVVFADNLQPTTLSLIPRVTFSLFSEKGYFFIHSLYALFIVVKASYTCRATNI